MNRIKITATSFLCYFAMAAIISPLGIVNSAMSTSFGIDLTSATAVFSYLTSGLLVGSFVAIFIFDFIEIRKVTLSQTFLFALAILVVHFSTSFIILCISFLVIGINAGILLSTAAVLLTKTYEDKMRASMLLATDSCYSIGGVISASAAGTIVGGSMSWTFSYIPAFIALVIILFLALVTKFPATQNTETNKSNEINSEKWPLTVYLCGLGLFLYILGFITIISWIPAYAKEVFIADDISAGKLISGFFIGQFVSQIIMFFVVHKVSIKKLILVIAFTIMLMTIAIWKASDLTSLNFLMLALGLAGGGLLKTSLGFGTLLTRIPSSRLVSFLVFCTGLGSALAPYLSAKIVDLGTIVNALHFASALYFGMAVVFAMMIYKSRSQDSMLTDN